MRSMERDEFIKRAVEALKEVVGSLEDIHVGNKTYVGAGDDIRAEDVYEKLMYDYPDVNEMELKALVVYVSGYTSQSGPQSRQGSASLMLMEEMFGSHGSSCDGDAMMRSKALTVVENLQRGAMALSGVWQELYGLHAFSLLSRDCGGASGCIVSYEDLFGKEGCRVREIALDEENAWASGRLVTALQGCIRRMSSFSEADVESRMDILFELLKYTMVQSIDRGHAVVVTAIFEALLGCVGGLQGFLQSMVRCRVSCMTAALIMECGMDAGLKQGHVQSVLMDVLAPERDSRRKDEDGVLVVAAAVCVEYLVRYGIRNEGMKSWKSRFESEMIRSGIYNACIQEFIRLTKRKEPSYGELSTMSRTLVLTACFSEDLRSWGVRVPGYCDAWHQYTHASLVVGMTWKVVSSMQGNDGHLQVLQHVFEDMKYFSTREDGMDSLEVEEQWLQQVIEQLSTLSLVTTALRGAIDSSNNTAKKQIILRIDQEREAVHDRITRLSHADDPLPLIQEEEMKEHGQPRQPSLLLLRSYRVCDGLLKSLSFSLKDSAEYRSTKDD